MAKTFEKTCIAINNRLHDKMGEKQQMMLFRKVYPAGPIYRDYKRRPKLFYCSECGCQVEWVGKECPQCKVHWKEQPQEDKKGWEYEYHMEMEAKGDIQLCRIYRVERHTWFGRSVGSYVWEVMRFMYAPNGERRVFARGVQGMSMYYDAFSRWTNITIKREGRNMSYSAMLRYNIGVGTYHIKSLTEQWKYKNIPALMQDYKHDTSALRVIAYPYGETMLKTGQKKFFDYLVREMTALPKGTEHALNICHRNHYEIDDPSLWLDHLYLLKFFRLDTHNAHYVCPKDLRAEHQVLLERKRRYDERMRALRAARERERMERERIERDKKYAEMMAHWPEHMGAILTLQLSGKNLNVRPLQSIDEFKQEGEAMHHCVYSMNYYDYNKRPNCLILSAKDGEGNRLATIEYNMARHDIVQCRAACNAVPERDSEIRSLITSHKNDFVRLMKKAA